MRLEELKEPTVHSIEGDEGMPWSGEPRRAPNLFGGAFGGGGWGTGGGWGGVGGGGMRGKTKLHPAESIGKKKELSRNTQSECISTVHSLDSMEVQVGDPSKVRVVHQSIVHNTQPGTVCSFIGPKLDNSVHQMFEASLIILLPLFLNCLEPSKLRAKPAISVC